MNNVKLVAVIAAAGIGKRVGADIPKQYLRLLDKTIIEHSIQPFLSHPNISQVIVSISKSDLWFKALPIASHNKVTCVEGGAERVDSVSAALNMIDAESYVLVHDAARPCITRNDIDKLITHVLSTQQGAILASRVRDTMKRSDSFANIAHTVERNHLWHALTPQMFNNRVLINAILGVEEQAKITDEASAMELTDMPVSIVEGRSDNIKVTRYEDLKLAEFYLTQKHPHN